MKRPVHLFSKTMLALVALVAAAGLQMVAQEKPQPAAAAQGGSVPKVAFEKHTLPNGLQLILHVDRKLPVVHVNQWFHVGSKNERQGRSGFAHLFEHMMFQGSKNASKEYFTYAEMAGANLREGGVNGTTNQDRTNYFVTVPSGNLENVLWFESDRLATLTEAITPEKLNNQRDVVKNERRQGLENTPYGRWFKLVAENLYPSRHPYANDVIGVHEDLTAATLEDVKEFFTTYYTPNNLSLVIAGDFDPVQAKSLVEKYFGSIAAGPALDRPAKGMVRLDGEKIVEVKDRVPQERTYFAWNTPAYFDPGDAELDLVTTILTDGLSARLNKALIYDRQLASDVVAFQASQPLTSTYVMWVTARPGTDLAEIERVVTDEIGRLAKSGPTEEELTRAKTKWEFNFVTGLERIGGFGGKADILNQYNTFLDNPDKFEADFSRYRSATVASVQDAVNRYLNTRNRLLVRFRPERSGRSASTTTMDRSKEPPLGGDKAFVAPEVKHAKLENGMELFVVERRDLPKVSVALATRAGSVADPAPSSGVASLTARVMRRGTAAKDALEIDTALGDLGTSLGWGVGRESARLNLDVLKRNLAPAVEILADVTRHPAFPAAEFEREKKLTLDTLAQQANNPNAVANRVSFMLGFGLDHPYGRPPIGLPQSVTALTRDDLAKFHQATWKPASTALVFAGDVTVAEATELARKYFGPWSGGAAPAVTIPPPQPVGPGKVFLIDRQDAAQTVVAQVLPAPPRKSEDYYAVVLADAVYGGGFGTRLNLNLREDKGYSYGVFSNPALLSNAGVIIAAGGVQTDKTTESTVEFMNELKNFAGAKPVSETELTSARFAKVRGYAQQFESLGRVADQILGLWTLRLPVAELQQEPEKLMSVPLAAVNAAAAKYAVPSGATLLLVGDLSKIEAGIRKLNPGEIVLLDVEGRPIGKKPGSSTP